MYTRGMGWAVAALCCRADLFAGYSVGSHPQIVLSVMAALVVWCGWMDYRAVKR